MSRRAPLRPCLLCGRAARAGQPCPHCDALPTSGKTSARGYDAAWQRLSRQVIAEVGACECGCGSTEDLTVDHINGDKRDRRRENLRVRSRRCHGRLPWVV